MKYKIKEKKDALLHHNAIRRWRTVHVRFCQATVSTQLSAVVGVLWVLYEFVPHCLPDWRPRRYRLVGDLLKERHPGDLLQLVALRGLSAGLLLRLSLRRSVVLTGDIEALVIGHVTCWRCLSLAWTGFFLARLDLATPMTYAQHTATKKTDRRDDGLSFNFYR